jgi:hypothetical protein
MPRSRGKSVVRLGPCRNFIYAYFLQSVRSPTLKSKKLRRFEPGARPRALHLGNAADWVRVEKENGPAWGNGAANLGGLTPRLGRWKGPGSRDSTPGSPLRSKQIDREMRNSARFLYPGCPAEARVLAVFLDLRWPFEKPSDLI